MRALPIGAVFVSVDSDCASGELTARLQRAIKLVPPGRMLVFFWSNPATACDDFSNRALLSNALLSPAADRTPEAQAEWTFFGEGCARAYPSHKSLRPTRISHWLAYRRQGPTTRELRQFKSDDAITQSKLQVAHPVFTRDAANDVWHLVDTKACTTMVTRLQMLFTWSDERAIVLRKRARSQARGSRGFRDDPVGTAVHVPYSWISAQLFPEDGSGVSSIQPRAKPIANIRSQYAS